jgi:8-oxo-dGTP pyrophosphatase MutT (NUDIX family)
MFLFNVRVYGVLINDEKQVLVSDEIIKGNYYTKFPGGGLEYGEGTRECLKREFLEELNLKIKVQDHIYTTDYFQKSAFHPDHQIISIYYYVHPLEPITVKLSETFFDFDSEQLSKNITSGIETFRFINWNNFSEDSMSLPIDKIVARMVKGN